MDESWLLLSHKAVVRGLGEGIWKASFLQGIYPVQRLNPNLRIANRSLPSKPPGKLINKDYKNVQMWCWNLPLKLVIENLGGGYAAIQCFMEELRHRHWTWAGILERAYQSGKKKGNRMGSGQKLDHPWGPLIEKMKEWVISGMKKAENICCKGCVNGGRPWTLIKWAYILLL